MCSRGASPSIPGVSSAKVFYPNGASGRGIRVTSWGGIVPEVIPPKDLTTLTEPTPTRQVTIEDWWPLPPQTQPASTPTHLGSATPQVSPAPQPGPAHTPLPPASLGPAKPQPLTGETNTSCLQAGGQTTCTTRTCITGGGRTNCTESKCTTTDPKGCTPAPPGQQSVASAQPAAPERQPLARAPAHQALPAAPVAPQHQALAPAPVAPEHQALPAAPVAPTHQALPAAPVAPERKPLPPVAAAPQSQPLPVQPAAPTSQPPAPQQQAPAAPAPPPSSASPPPEAQRSGTSSVASGEERQVGSATSFDKNCSPLPVTVTITQPPANGTASVVAGTVEGGTLKAGTDPGDCMARPRQGQKVMYRSNAGFHGTDTLIYHVVGSRTSWTTTVTINVR
jgi:hypothetical protein